MSTYYCHDCALRNGFYKPYDTASLNLTGCAYQFGKYIKHTAPTGGYENLLSIFNRPDYNDYLTYTVSASLSGCAEVDSAGRTNMIWYAGRHVGITYSGSKYFCADDSIKVVLHHDVTLIHSFPVNWEQHYIKSCHECGSYILS
jgi:hypothetical protein